jgi:hypothetical protein
MGHHLVEQAVVIGVNPFDLYRCIYLSRSVYMSIYVQSTVNRYPCDYCAHIYICKYIYIHILLSLFLFISQSLHVITVIIMIVCVSYKYIAPGITQRQGHSKTITAARLRTGSRPWSLWRRRLWPLEAVDMASRGLFASGNLVNNYGKCMNMIEHVPFVDGFTWNWWNSITMLQITGG